MTDLCNMRTPPSEVTCHERETEWNEQATIIQNPPFRSHSRSSHIFIVTSMSQGAVRYLSSVSSSHQPPTDAVNIYRIYICSINFRPTAFQCVSNICRYFYLRSTPYHHLELFFSFLSRLHINIQLPFLHLSFLRDQPMHYIFLHSPINLELFYW